MDEGADRTMQAPGQPISPSTAKGDFAVAKAYITYGCGHTEKAGFYRRKDADWAADHPKPLCSACYQAEWDRKRAATREASAAKNAENAEKAFEHGYRMLSGTERQVAWAYSIREQAMAAAKAELEDWRTRPVRPGKEQAVRDLVAQGEQALLILADKPEASWWIDRRHDTGGWLLYEVVRTLDEVPA